MASKERPQPQGVDIPDTHRQDMEATRPDTFISDLEQQVKLYEGCGNMLGIVPLTTTGYPEGQDFRQDAQLRKYLTDWGRKIHSDSVMVLTGDPSKRAEQGYDVYMYVFEPNGDDGTGLGGGISTMCGNGIRAVAAYIREQNPSSSRAEIMTMSGIKTVEWENDLYSVEMGELHQTVEALKNYVHPSKVEAVDGEYFESPIPTDIVEQLSRYSIDASKWSIGLNGDRDASGNIDGEPHIMVEIPESQAPDLETLRKLAVEAGPTITKALAFFPKEININFVVVKGIGSEDNKLHILNCTHERNLGDDADHSVTAACGTGSTVSSGALLRKYFPDETDRVVVVHNTGGDLEIQRDPADPRRMIMKGPATMCET